MHKIVINSGRKKYSAKFTDQIQDTLKVLTNKYITHLLIDKTVYGHYKNMLDNYLKFASSVYFIKPLEQKKTLTEVHKYINFLLAKKVQKNHKIIVVGGALVQDIGSFTSHIVLRGIDWIFIPTTLLAMADSCIGSKSGINVGKFKNQVGSFHPPIEIHIYPPFLKTLPKSELLNGIGEIIKHFFIKGELNFSDIRTDLDLIGNDMLVAKKIIYKSLLIKKDIIEKDEYEEKEIRKLLNYGHTFGHALEGYSENKISHGVAVLNGIDMANFISFKKGFLSKNQFLDFHKFIRKYIPYKEIPITNINLYLEFLSRDKKAVGHSINTILCKGLGEIIIFKMELDKKIAHKIMAYCKFYNQETQAK